MEYLESVRRTFWNEKFWLPPNVTWKDLENQPGSPIYKAQPGDLKYALMVALALLVFRVIWERLVALPIGRLYKLKEKPYRSAPFNEVLEVQYRKNKRPSFSAVQSLGKECHMSAKQVERWFRRRRQQGHLTEMQKFRETSWRFLMYTIIAVYLFVTTPQYDFFWDTKLTWSNFPEKDTTPQLYFLYIGVLGFYGSLFLSQFWDNKRKDFWEMFIHHIITISLMSFSYVLNHTRAGALVLSTHDICDFWVEGAKMAKPLGFNRTATFGFIMFITSWFFGRIVVFPYRVLYTTVFETSEVMGSNGWFTYVVFFNGLLCLLFILDIYWFQVLVKVLIKIYRAGDEDLRDTRSETEEELSDEHEADNINHNATNGKKY